MKNNLLNLFDSLSVPEEQEGGVTTFSSVVSQNSSRIHIGKDTEMRPVIIIKGLSREQEFPQATSLKNLRVEHKIRCKISPINAPSFIDRFSIVRCLSSERGLHEYFLKIMDFVISTIEDDSMFKRIRYAIDKLAELFHLLDQPSSASAQGLWAELFVIVNASNPLFMIETWHVDMRDRFDFSFGEQRLEIKSSATRRRQHHFSFEQAYPPAGTTTIIASLYVERSTKGKTLSDLWEKVRDFASGDTESLLKIENICMSILGSTWEHARQQSYDEQLATESLEFFDINDIPRVPNIITEGVSDIRFRSNLELTQPVNIIKYQQSGSLFKACIPKQV